MEPCDGELVAAALAGERVAFSQLVDRYRDAVCGVAYHYLGGFDDIQDAAQEAFVQAYCRLSQLRDPDRFGPWLRAITANVCKQALRSRKTELALRESDEEPEHSQSDEHRAAVRLIVTQALKQLPESTRLTVTLSYINGYSHAEVAGFLGVPLNTVRSRLQHAKKQLREEMIGMVSDVLHEGKPDPESIWRAVEEATRQAHEAHARRASGDAIRYYDEALAALDDIQPDEKQLRYKMHLLSAKANAASFPQGYDEAVRLMEQALAIAVEIGDKQAQACTLENIGVTCSNGGQKDKSEESYRKALEIYAELEDAGGQGRCLMWMGSRRMIGDLADILEGKQYYERSIPLSELAECWEWVAVSKAMLKLLDEVGDERFLDLPSRTACCLLLKKETGTVDVCGDVGSGRGGGQNPEAPMLEVTAPFWHLSHLQKFLDESVPVGGSWSGDAFSYSYQPLKATVTVVSKTEAITTAAGSFTDCLLTEQVTTESDLPDDADDRKKWQNRHFLCGVVRAWYAPGVGLIRLHTRKQEGPESVMELDACEIAGGGKDYMPLEIGNRWVYGWPDAPTNWTAREDYEVTARRDSMFYVQRHSYAYKNG